jgi:ubiquinone biosynthesis protein UbiJ
MPSMLDTLAATLADGALGAALRADPATRIEATALAPRRLRLVSERPALSLTLVFTAEGVRVEAERELPADATVTTTPTGMVDLLAGDRTRAVLSGNVRIEGDGDFVQTALAVLGRLQPDLEGPLAGLLGDAPAAAIGAAARRGGALARSGLQRSGAAWEASLTSPEGPLPGRIEVNRFLDQVDDLRLDADRLEARVRRLGDRVAAVDAEANPSADPHADPNADPHADQGDRT